MIGALFTGLLNYFSATSGEPAVHNAFYLSVNGRLYRKEIPDSGSYPCVVMSLVTDTSNSNFSSSFEDCIVQFNIYSKGKGKSSVEVDDVLAKLVSFFDKSRPTVSGYSTVHMKRELTRESPRLKDEDIQQCSVRYRVLLRK